MTSAAAGGGSLAARFVAIDSRRYLAPGEVVWNRRGRIVAVRKARGAVADICLLPGLVNAHAHLQIAPLAAPERDFVPWIGAVLRARAQGTMRGERQQVAEAVTDLLASGATAVGDIDSTGNGRDLLRRSPLRGRSYRELTGFHLDRVAARTLVRERWHGNRSGVLAAGLSPHAPYSVSAELFRAAARQARHLAIHCAEVPEEQQFLRTGRGPFADLLAQLGRLPEGFRAPGCGAVAWLQQLAVLRATTQLVHCQELLRGDVARIAAAGASIVVCPGTITYFRRQPPAVPAWLRAGIPVALGTDSRASNASLSMRDELAAAASMWPGLSPSDLFKMATTNGARSLGTAGLGTLRPGAAADFLVVPAAASFTATLAAFVHGQAPLQAVVCGGRRRRAHTSR